MYGYDNICFIKSLTLLKPITGPPLVDTSVLFDLSPPAQSFLITCVFNPVHISGSFQGATTSPRGKPRTVHDGSINPTCAQEEVGSWGGYGQTPTNNSGAPRLV